MKNESMTTWYNVLDEYVILLKKQEKRAFEAALGIASPSTVIRWRKGATIPGPKHLEQLYALLPEKQRQEFVSLLQRDPRAWMKTPPSLRALVQEQSEPEDTHSPSLQRKLLDPFFLRILRVQREASERFWEIGTEILKEAVMRMETHPTRTGVQVTLAVCSVPQSDAKVRSLRASLALGTHPWPDYPHYEDYFLGAETLAGRVVTQRHSGRVLDLQQQGMSLPVTAMEHERSSAAFPILNKVGVAGALVVSSVQTGFFTGERLELIEVFADLLRSAFYDHDFRDPSSIDLRLMPKWSVQKEHILQLQPRVEAYYQKLLRQEDALPELPVIEERVRQEMECELLHLVGLGESPVS